MKPSRIRDLKPSLNHILVAILLLPWASNAHAYLDPGSGSMMLQLLLAGLAGLAVTLKVFWGKVSRLFRSKAALDEGSDDSA